MNGYNQTIAQQNGGSQPPVDAPVNLVETEFGRLWVVPVCPFCSYRHTHSAGYLWDDPADWLGERTTWCTGEARTYRLVEAVPT